MHIEEINVGHQLLDIFYGEEWVFEINDDTLDMSSDVNDLLGQLFGCYELGLNELCIEIGTGFGFCCSNNESYEVLKTMQLRAINKLREERKCKSHIPS